MNKTDLVKRKILTLGSLLKLISIWSLQDDKIVFTNGCFDLLHMGHIDYLAKAADMGTRLIVGLNTDQSTSLLKGINRPITDQQSRASVLASLFFVDAVVLFDETTPLSLIEAIKPDILVKGADYSINQIVGADSVIAAGGEVKTIEYLPGYSTTAIEKKIRNS